MTTRVGRIVGRIGLNPLFARGRKPKIVPMTREDERIQAEIHRRRQEKLKDERGL